MAQIGEKRPAEDQIGPEDVADGTPDEPSGFSQADSGASPSSPPPMTSSASPSPSATVSSLNSGGGGGGGIVFRPSLLQSAAQGFAFKQSSLNPIVASKFGSSPTPVQPGSSDPPVAATAPKSGGKFLKLDSDDIKTITITTPTIMLADSSKATNQIADGVNHNHSQRDNPFMQFLSSPPSVSQTFSSLVSSTAPVSSGFATAATPTGKRQLPSEVVEEEEGESGESSAGPREQRDKDEGGGHTPSRGPEGGSVARLEGASPQCETFGSQPVTAILPEVQRVTGEEREKNIVQVPARLYAFDVSHQSWKERGRGEVRLNDACQSEGVFQSRLVMRTLGSYHVLLNTHLWAQMKCERANQKSIRITAQHGSDGNVSVFLIMGAAKDIQQLYTAVDRRIQALRRNASESGERGEDEATPAIISSSEAQMASFDEDDKESFLDGPHSSPESSPEPHSSTRLRPVQQQQFGTETSDNLEDDEVEVSSSSVKEDEEDRAKIRASLSPKRPPAATTAAAVGTGTSEPADCDQL